MSQFDDWASTRDFLKTVTPRQESSKEVREEGTYIRLSGGWVGPMEVEPREVFERELAEWHAGRRPETWQPENCQSEPKRRGETRQKSEQHISEVCARMMEKLR